MQPFAKVYSSVARSKKLTLSAKVLVSEILISTVENGFQERFPIPRRRTALNLGMGSAQVERAIRNLIAEGFLEEVARGLYRATSLLLEGKEVSNDCILCKVYDLGRK